MIGMVVDDVVGCCLHLEIGKEEHFSMKNYNKLGDIRREHG